MSPDRSIRLIAAVAALALAVGGCALVEHPDVALPPAPSIGCTPATATIETGALKAGDDTVVLAESAGFVDGKQSTPAITHQSGVVLRLDEEDAARTVSSGSAEWIAAIVAQGAAQHGPLPTAFGDEASLDELGTPIAFQNFGIGQGSSAIVGTYVLATIAPTKDLPFTVTCGGHEIAKGSIESPDADSDRRSAIVQCGEDPGDDPDAQIATSYCEFPFEGSQKDPNG